MTRYARLRRERDKYRAELQRHQAAIRPLLRAVREWRRYAHGIESRGPMVRTMVAAYDALPDDIKAEVDDVT